MSGLENNFLSYLIKDVSLFTTYDRLKNAGLIKKDH